MKIKIGHLKDLIEGNIYSKDINSEHIIFFKLGNKVYAIEGFFVEKYQSIVFINPSL